MKKTFIIMLCIIMLFATSSVALANSEAKVSSGDIANFLNDTTYIVVVEGNGNGLDNYLAQNADAYHAKVDKLAKMTPTELEKAKIQLVKDTVKLTADNSNVVFPKAFVNYVKENCPQLLTAVEGKTAVEFNVNAIGPQGEVQKSVTANFWWGSIPTYSITFKCEWGWDSNNVILYDAPSTTTSTQFQDNGIIQAFGPNQYDGGKTWKYFRKGQFFYPYTQPAGTWVNPYATFYIKANVIGIESQGENY